MLRSAAIALALLLPTAVFASEVVVFRDFAPYASNAEIARRMLSPQQVQQLETDLARSGGSLAGQPLDPKDESYLVYLPKQMPANGYALLVFVPPWKITKIPEGWGDVFERDGVLFVEAFKSGNSTNVLFRRVPLALDAAYNAEKQYKIDPDKVFVGGFSGGSRVALRLNLAYPDVFRGAFLDAGSDPIGTEGAPLPPRDFFLRARSNRFVYVAGENDTTARSLEAASRSSLKAWCIGDVHSITTISGHDVADPGSLSKALDLLLAPKTENTDTACLAGIASKLN